MSYRDLRNFSEAMRVLGFPQPISLESFRVPNWELMEECLRWVAKRVECDAELPRGGPEHRVALVTQAISLFHSRANLKLNGKRVYGADGWAVRELLKVATFLREALSAPPPAAREEAAASYDVSSRLGEIKQARALSTDITARGAFLYDLLAKEVENKDTREAALSRPLDMSAMEACLRRALDAVSARVAAARDQIDNVAASEAALDAKLERRRAELQRAEKRLHTVQKIKPAYAGELSALESEISVLWDRYVVRYRCVEALKHQLSVLETSQAEVQPAYAGELSALESEISVLWDRYVVRYRCVEALKHQLSVLETSQAEAAEEQQAAIMQLIHKYEAEDVLGKLSDSEESSSSEDDKELSEAKHPPRPATRPKTRLRIKTAGGSGAEARRAFGSMAAARDSLDDIRDEDDSRSDSDFSDTQLYGGAGDTGSRWSRPRARPATRTIAPADDDDDFADLIEGVERGGGAGRGAAGAGSDSLGSSSESELRVTSAAAGVERHQLPLSDNEF